MAFLLLVFSFIDELIDFFFNRVITAHHFTTMKSAKTHDDSVLASFFFKTI